MLFYEKYLFFQQIFCFKLPNNYRCRYIIKYPWKYRLADRNRSVFILKNRIQYDSSLNSYLESLFGQWPT